MDAYFEYILKLTSNLPLCRNQLTLMKAKVAGSCDGINGWAVLNSEL
jgi:hypothetical protein